MYMNGRSVLRKTIYTIQLKGVCLLFFVSGSSSTHICTFTISSGKTMNVGYKSMQCRVDTTQLKNIIF